MKLIHQIIILCVMCMVSLIGILQLNVITHEEIHKQIFTMYNCKNVSVNINFLSGDATCQKYVNQTVTEHSNEKMLHQYNEIVGYNFTTLIITIMCATILICLTMVILKNEN